LQKIASDFDQIATGKIVFPQAKKSMQSIQKNLYINTDVNSLVVYENTPKVAVEQRSESILIFTSPMSAEAYFRIHAKGTHQTIVSIGKTTTRKLTELGITDVKTAFEPSSWSLADEVFSL